LGINQHQSITSSSQDVHDEHKDNADQASANRKEVSKNGNFCANSASGALCRKGHHDKDTKIDI